MQVAEWMCRCWRLAGLSAAPPSPPRMLTRHGSCAQQCPPPPKGFLGVLPLLKHHILTTAASLGRPWGVLTCGIYLGALWSNLQHETDGNCCLMALSPGRGMVTHRDSSDGARLTCVWHYHLACFRQFSLSPAKFFPCLEIWVKIRRYGLSSSIQVRALDSVKSCFEMQGSYSCNFPHLFFA